VLDNYAYLVNKIGRRKEMDPLITHWLTTYGALVKVPIWKAPSFDGVRDVGLEFQREIDHTLETLIAEFGVSVLRLEPCEMGTWTARVLDYLQLPARA
jgi:hypothetical protein